MFIRTDRLFLRPSWPEDLEELLAVLADDSVVRGIGVAMLPRSVPELREYLSRPREFALPHFFINARTDDGAHVAGGIGLARSGDDIELGYWIAPSHRGHGYALEAVRAVLELLPMLGHSRIIAAHFDDNAASVRVLMQAGFKPAEERRTRYSVGRGEYASVRVYVADLDEMAKDHSVFSFATNQAGATAGAISSTRK